LFKNVPILSHWFLHVENERELRVPKRKWTLSVRALDSRPCPWLQGDPIGPIFAYWANVYFGQIFWKFLKQSKFLGRFFNRKKLRTNCDKKGPGWILGDFFQPLIWSPCLAWTAFLSLNRKLWKPIYAMHGQGLPDGIFSNPKITIWVNLGVYCNPRCWYILWPFGQFSTHLVYFVVIFYIFFSCLGILYHEKSGNPGKDITPVTIIICWCVLHIQVSVSSLNVGRSP
jgi:hypothetical protein